MKIERQVTKVEVIEPVYFRINAGVRYWEDGSVNGEDDIEYEEQVSGVQPRMPFAVLENNEWRWKLTINLEDGHIENWPTGTTASAFYKVCDDGEYAILGVNKEVIDSKNCYVPDILSVGDKGYGDYIIFSVDENGYIKNWWNKEDLEKLIKKFFETKGF